MSPVSRFLTLQRLIIGLATLSAAVMLLNAVIASYQVQRQQLVESTLEANRVYASKLAQTTHHFLVSAQQQLAYSARMIGSNPSLPDIHSIEARRLNTQTSSFNSIVVVGSDSRVLATAPHLPALQGKRLSNVANTLAITRRAPLVSDPYVSATGKLVLTISHPIHSADGEYLGYVTASIHLKEQNILHTLLGTHYYRDGSYLYVVGRDGSLLYHPEANRVGESALQNAAVRAVRRGEAGALHAVNSHGVHMLAGYAPIPAVGWGVVAQRPVAATLSPLQHLTRTVLRNAAPLGIVSLVFIWFFSRRIARPLWELARNVQNPDVSQAISKVTAVHSWYYEAAQLRRAVLGSFRTFNDRIGQLGRDALTDPLTGLLNRRGLEHARSELIGSGLSFGVVALDLDHFKKINDQHGHAAGDTVIAGLGELMRQGARSEDVLARVGGEEFLILLPGVDLEGTTAAAERLRARVREASLIPGTRVTVSAGVSHHPQTHVDPDRAIRQSDKALYSAKLEGRDRVSVYRSRAPG